MPANPKYLASSFQRFLKITAAILGGYFVSMSFHVAIAAWVDQVPVLITMTYMGYILWVALMIVAFLANNGWKIWGIYLLMTATFTGLYLAGS